MAGAETHGLRLVALHADDEALHVQDHVRYILEHSGEGRELMRQPATFVSDEHGKIPAGLKSINFCRAGEVVARDKTWVQRPQLTGGSGCED